MPTLDLEISSPINISEETPVAVVRRDSSGDSLGTGAVTDASVVAQSGSTENFWIVLEYASSETRPAGDWTIKVGLTSINVTFKAGEDIYSEFASPVEDIVDGVLAGLDSVSITRLGAEYDPDTSTVTLIQADDYQGDRGLSFALSVPGVDLETCSVVFGTGDAEFLPVLEGTAELEDASGSTATLKLTWTRSQTNKPASSKYAWGAVIIDSDGLTQTVIRGPLTLTKAAVSPARVTAAIPA